MDEASEHAARQPGVGSSEDGRFWVLVGRKGHFDLDGD